MLIPFGRALPCGHCGPSHLRCIPGGDFGAMAPPVERVGLRQRPRPGQPSVPVDRCLVPTKSPDRGPNREFLEMERTRSSAMKMQVKVTSASRILSWLGWW